MTSKLRPAVDVICDLDRCSDTACSVAIIAADREAVRAPLLAEIERLTVQLEVESQPSPYCPICGSCGEDGCCGPQRGLYPTTEQDAELAKRCRDGYPEADGWSEEALYTGPTPPNGGSDAE